MGKKATFEDHQLISQSDSLSNLNMHNMNYRNIPDSQGNQKSYFDLETLLSRCGNKKELVLKLIDIVLQDLPKQMEKIDLAIKNENTEELYKTAHKIKGTSSNMEFSALKIISEKLQKTGRDSENITAEIKELTSQLKNEWDILLPILSNLKVVLSI